VRRSEPRPESTGSSRPEASPRRERPRARAGPPTRPALPDPGAGPGSSAPIRPCRRDDLAVAGRNRAGPFRGQERGDVSLRPAAFQRRRAVERVSPRTDGLVRAPLPVGQVVAALMPGPRPVRDLVASPARRRPARSDARWYWSAARSSSCSGRAASRQRLAPRAVGRWSPISPGETLGVRVVERQRVEREVVRAEVERGTFSSRLPAVDGLTRDVVQEVQVDGADPGGPCLRHGRGHVLRGVAPAEAPQLRGVQALRAKRDPVHARRRE
jgi:hypothetical protein